MNPAAAERCESGGIFRLGNRCSGGRRSERGLSRQEEGQISLGESGDETDQKQPGG